MRKKKRQTGCIGSAWNSLALLAHLTDRKCGGSAKSRGLLGSHSERIHTHTHTPRWQDLGPGSLPKPDCIPPHHGPYPRVPSIGASTPVAHCCSILQHPPLETMGLSSDSWELWDISEAMVRLFWGPAQAGLPLSRALCYIFQEKLHPYALDSFPTQLTQSGVWHTRAVGCGRDRCMGLAKSRAQQAPSWKPRRLLLRPGPGSEQDRG